MTDIVAKCPSCGEDIPYDIEYMKLRMEIGGRVVTGFCPRCLDEHILTSDGKIKRTGRKFNPHAAVT